LTDNQSILIDIKCFLCSSSKELPDSCQGVVEFTRS
jgi:hypothetical protein